MFKSRRLEGGLVSTSLIQILLRGHELDSCSRFQGSSVSSLREIYQDWSEGMGAFLMDPKEKHRTVQLW